MKKTIVIQLISVYLRLSIGIVYLWEVADRLGILGANGQPHVGWGDWTHFLSYAEKVMAFLPGGLIPFLAIIASVGEAGFGLLLVLGLFTRFAAVGSGLLSGAFAISMAISFGIDAPFAYSVFALSAGSLLLATLPAYRWSLDGLTLRHHQMSSKLTELTTVS